MEWKDGRLVEADILSRLGGPLHVRYDGKTRTYDTNKGARTLVRP
jgi:hypothetical protein